MEAPMQAPSGNEQIVAPSLRVHDLGLILRVS
jgi:hypothetical protein